ncbi:hypothetical protein [Embleya sp. NPDC020886]|uniref:hypothetical protein n=1 Tax=Embleya sp. NPDC020886 TaxID=3363980 RepID=UPI0037873EF0
MSSHRARLRTVFGAKHTWLVLAVVIVLMSATQVWLPGWCSWSLFPVIHVAGGIAISWNVDDREIAEDERME